jgi:hypothetical protein
MSNLIHVMAAKADDKTVLWETDPMHVTDDNPTGEIFIAGNGTSVEVGRTPEIEKRLKDGTLIEVKPGGKAQKQAKEADTTFRPAHPWEAPPDAINPVVETKPAAAQPATPHSEYGEKPVGGKRK